jgi:hypothetical protein
MDVLMELKLVPVMDLQMVHQMVKVMERQLGLNLVTEKGMLKGKVMGKWMDSDWELQMGMGMVLQMVQVLDELMVPL